ncbi:unnamed protein product [Rhodiola kirilowii]
MKLTHLFNNVTCTQPNVYWPSCSQHPKTLSFRSIAYDNESYFKVISNNITTYCNDSSPTALLIDEEEDLLDDVEGGVERVIRGFIKSDRLFFEPVETNSILSHEAAKKLVNGRCSSSGSSDIMEKKTTHVSLVPIESLDPYLDFKKSMEEMVEAQYHEDKQADWDWLQELLGCYLKVNGKSNHEYIIQAFVDLLASEF